MPTKGRYTISVVVNGVDLPEYEPPENDSDDDYAYTRYIEVDEGTKFGVKINCDGKLKWMRKDVFIFDVDLDHDNNLSTVIDPCHYEHRASVTYTKERKIQLEGDSWVGRPFMFNKLITTDVNPKSKEIQKLARNLGTIKAVLWQATRKTRDYPAEKKTYNIEPIPEKALKGKPIDMSASFGEAVAAPPLYSCDSRRIGSPLFECVFKYRSRRALQMLDIIPASPEPLPLHQRDPNSLNLNEARQLLQQLQTGQIKTEQNGSEDKHFKQEDTPNNRAIREKRRGKKRRTRQQDDDGEDDDVTFIESRPTKRPAIAPGEVVDLT